MLRQFSLLFPVFSGSAFTASPGHSSGWGKLSAPQRRGHCQGSLLAPRPRTRIGMTRPPHSSSESLDVGRWGWEPLSSCSFPALPSNPHPILFSLVFLPPFTTLPSSPSQVPRRSLSVQGWRTPGGSCALGRGFQETGVNVGAGAAGRHRPTGAGAAGAAEGCSRLRGRGRRAEKAGPLGGGITRPLGRGPGRRRPLARDGTPLGVG